MSRAQYPDRHLPPASVGRALGEDRTRTLAVQLVEALGQRIRQGQVVRGGRLPTEAAIMAEFNVSRTVVREALSQLQAAGLVRTRHGVGTFVEDLDALAAEGGGFRIAADRMATLQDVIAVLELRIGVETEAAGLAAQRRTAADLAALRAALDAVDAAMAAGDDAAAADFQFHLALASATQNPHYARLMATLGPQVIPRARLAPGVPGQPPDPAQLAYLRRVQQEHENLFDAVQSQDAEAARAAMRTHLVNSRERRRRAAEEAGQASAATAATQPAR